MKRLSILIVLALAGCGDDAAAPDAAKGKAAEVREGSISDAMIPLDQLESQGPLMPQEGAAVDDAGSARSNAASGAVPEGNDDSEGRDDAGEPPAPPASEPAPAG